MRRSLYPLLICALAACDDGEHRAVPTDDPTPPEQMAPHTDAPPEAPPPDVDCLPDRAAWDATHKAQVDGLCGDCHGAVPQFGAPYGLLDYEALVAGDEGERTVDLLAIELSAATMPPAGEDQPDTSTRAGLIDWATCGGDSPVLLPNPGGIDSDRPVLGDPGVPPEGTDFFDLRVRKFAVSEDWDDHYECFTFEVPLGEPRYIRRIETLIGDARVLHHTVLMPDGGGRSPGEHGRCQNDNPLDLIYGWAPGQGPLHFDEGGILVEPGQRMTLQIHYNNIAGHRDVQDSSGVRIYHGPVEGPRVNMAVMGPIAFEIPARGASSATGWCRLPADTTMIASFPHMHELGVGFEQIVERADGTEETIIRLDNWDFEYQYIYETPIELQAGDRVRTICHFRNEGNRPVGFGPNTADEMCFNFAYVSPPLPRTFCNSGSPPPDTPPYSPGECAPAGAEDVEVSAVEAELRVGSPRGADGGELPSGLWMLTGGALYVPALSLGPITIDPDATVIAAQGLLGLEDGKANLDLQVQLHLVTDTTDFDQEVAISVAGGIRPGDRNPSDLVLDVECGDGEALERIRYTANSDQVFSMIVGLNMGGITLNVELWFQPAP